MKKLRIVSCVTSDLFSDQRVHRISGFLAEKGHDMFVIGREKPDSPPLNDRNYEILRMKLWFSGGKLFYAEYNLRLFWKLLFISADILVANDLDTLPAVAVVAKIRQKKLVFDSHEYFTEVPELIGRPIIKSIWRFLERIFLPAVNRVMTVSSSIAIALSERCGMEAEVVRNLPYTYDLEKVRSGHLLRIDPGGDFRTIIYQGSVNVDRGLEELVEAMEFMPLCKLFILGDGDVLQDLKQRAAETKWDDRIFFTGRIPLEELPSYTVQADLGISIEKDSCLSYRFALPNKFFDYIQAGIPSVISDLPEMVRINNEFDVATVISSYDPREISKTILALFADEERYNKLRENCMKARKALNWEKESGKLNLIFST